MTLKDKQYDIKDILKIPFQYSPFYSFLIIILKVIGGIVPTISMLATAGFINATINKLQKNNDTYISIVIPLVCIVICAIYSWCSTQLIELAEAKLENNLRKTFRVFIVERIASLKYNYIENAESCNLISRVIKEPETQCQKGFSKFFDLVYLILKILGILIILFTQIWWAAIIIFLIAIPVFKIAIKGGEVNYAAYREAQKYNRKANYYSEVLTGRDAVSERALFNYSDKVNEYWYSQFDQSRKLMRKANINWARQAGLGGFATSLLTASIVILLIFPVKSGVLTIGLFISIINNVVSLIPDLSWELPECAEVLAQNLEYMKDLSAFINLDNNSEYLDLPDKNPICIETVEFKKVSFRYPDSKQFILNNLCIKIEKGKHYAFVGINGAGKSTIIKLLLGLYEDFDGEILINGISIKNYTQSQLKSMFSVVFQDYAKYAVTLKDNILLGNIQENSISEILNIMNIIDLNNVVNNLPNGIDSYLGKIHHNSVDISGGQWQRVAMARAMMSCATIRILDEPTASLDPISESKLYEKFEEISKGQTTIFISHRLGSTKLADIIYVIENGSVIEKGNYYDLMKNNGTYSRMFESQRSWYENEK
ncbi:ATP-binding cassette, subfamily B [Anaerosporobacter mobilis DSM 15930]|jgi:ATP-binding cassette subfamily B protein|uniref:ATP-binding cassette, subfamily B n=1 Tax=Anaerosporobacter mobilis DSM 15930 TaxID=1120996 RepID=A0A1M7I5Z4_9FIRM|nr:ABC transporter ATP-binding protein [Anaerosporobacter mobilis]SHM36115.1 ATP-binding cassette, subfamily B [Anaerosporobacter mobilis DSM 15930]